MKKIISILACLVVLSVAAPRVIGGIVLQEDFAYPDGIITNVSNGKWAFHSGNQDLFIVNEAAQINAGVTSAVDTGDANISLTSPPYTTNGPVAALYVKFTINVGTLPTGAGTYFSHLKDTGTSNFRCRIFVSTNGVGAAGLYRVGIANMGSSQTNVTTDLSPGTTYTIVARYVLSTGLSTLWVNPANEASPGVTATDAPGLLNIYSFALRQSTGAGTLNVDNLLVGTSFADVVPSSAGSNPPLFVVQPQDTNVSAGVTVTFNTLAVGDQPINFAWFFNTNTPLNVTGQTLTLSNVGAINGGTYSAVASGPGGTTTSRFAVLSVSTGSIPPIITNQPSSLTVTVGGTANFTVVAGGSPPLSYQWKFNNTNLPGANNATLTLSSVTPSQAGPYFVTITNQFGFTNSATVTLTVNPAGLTNIAYLRSKVDQINWNPTDTNTLYTVRGIVTTYANMTTSAASSEFYIQDDTGGIVVFWSGASPGTNLPPAGALVQVSATNTSFNGLLEIEPVAGNPVHSVTVVSTGNPLPVAQPLPFDPIIVNNPTNMEKLEGSYVVASNVFLNLNTPTFGSGVEDYITNSLGQTFILFINAGTDIPGKLKPTGPVTIYGVLGQFDSSDPRDSSYEITPSRFADIIPPVRWNNILRNLTRLGDQPTNSFSESVLRPGETLTMNVTVSDPAGGSVTATPITGNLPSGSSWAVSGSLSGIVVTNTFQFQPTSANAGNNYPVGLSVTIGGKTSTTLWNIYVPTPAEQQVVISEFLANPTTTSNAPGFNPLRRASDTSSISVNDQYAEIANLSSSTLDLLNWTVGDATTVRHHFYSGSPSEQLSPSNSIIVFGGPLNPQASTSPNLPVPSFPASESSAGLALSTSGGAITLHNGNGYLVSRVVYSRSDIVSGVGSLSRFPTVNSSLVPQAYVSTNYTTPGLQYDGGAWNQPTKVPTGVTGVKILAGNPIQLKFTANTGLTSTLWSSSNLNNKFSVLLGQQFTNSAATFSVTNPPTPQFYFITTQ